MAFYGYKAIDGHGEVYRGFFEGEHLDALCVFLHEHGLFLTRSKILSERRWFRKKRRTNILSQSRGYEARVPDETLEELCLHLASLERAGLSVVDSLDVVLDFFQHQKTLKTGLKNVQYALKKGRSLSQSFETCPKIFNSVFCCMVAAGEHLGSLEQTFDQLARFFRWRSDMRCRVHKSLRYPLLLMVFVVFLGVVLIGWVVPELESFLKSMTEHELPFLTKSLIFVSHHAFFSLGLLMWALGFLGLSGWAIRVLSKKGAQKMDGWVLRIPLIGPLIRKVSLHHFLQVLIPLILRGVPLLESLEMGAKTVHNLFLRDLLLSLSFRMSQGDSFSQAWLSLPLLKEPLLGRLARTGERSGQLAEQLTHGLVFIQRDVEELTQKIASFLEPLLLMVLGGVLLWIIFGLFLPLYHVNLLES